MGLKIILWIFLMSIFCYPVLSLGVAPVQHLMQFEAEATKEYTLIVLNNEGKDFSAKISVSSVLT